MAESVKQYGVLSPAIARPLPDGGYELVSGHRRKRACELAGLETMPVIVRELDDDAAVILVVDSNLQREGLLPSERAFAYKLMFDEPKQKASCIANRQLLGVPCKGNGWPGIHVRWCTGQLKTHLISREVNRLRRDRPCVQYISWPRRSSPRRAR